jgi:NADH dehydrogenase
MKKVMVLGGTGFVGQHVCEKLVREGWSVTVVTRRRTNASHVQHLPLLTVLEFDVHNEAALTAALVGHDAVVNLVAILHGNQAVFDKVHVALPQKLGRACVAARVHQLVHVSALGADPLQPEAAPSLYLRSKSQGEAVLLQAAANGARAPFALSVLRPSVVFGAEDQFLNLFARLQVLAPFVPLAGAEARFQPVWVEDVATAVVRCLALGGSAASQSAPRVIEACGPEVFTLRQLVQLAGRLSGVRDGQGRPVFGLPNWLGRLQATLMEFMPGQPLMSRDNLDSMQRPNVATGKLPGLASLGITPAALQPVAEVYLRQGQPDQGLPGVRARARGG